MASTNVLTERRYSHSLVTYATEEEFAPILELAKHYAYIKHDKDVNEDGTPKETHYHILITFEREKSLAWIRKHIASDQNTLSQPIKSIGEAFEYLWHKNDKSKAQYEKAEVITDSYKYWERYSEEDVETDDKNEMFVNDLMAEDYSPIKMAKKYGRDFIRYFKQYNDFREQFKGDYNNG